jgi:hypothetical protein
VSTSTSQGRLVQVISADASLCGSAAGTKYDSKREQEDATAGMSIALGVRFNDVGVDSCAQNSQVIRPYHHTLAHTTAHPHYCTSTPPYAHPASPPPTPCPLLSCFTNACVRVGQALRCPAAHSACAACAGGSGVPGSRASSIVDAEATVHCGKRAKTVFFL